MYVNSYFSKNLVTLSDSVFGFLRTSVKDYFISYTDVEVVTGGSPAIGGAFYN
jgi:hypothetical protein